MNTLKDKIDTIINEMIEIERTRKVKRDLNLANKMLQSRYLYKNEKTYSDLINRVLSVLPQDDYRTKFLRQAMLNTWIIPATPVLSNLGTVDRTKPNNIGRGLPISCFLTSVEDDIAAIIGNHMDISVLGSLGGGVGIDYTNVAGLGEEIKNGTTAGTIPFIQISETISKGISQGSLRRASFVVKNKIGHPDYEEFLQLRNPNGGDQDRKALKIHHTVEFDDEFMYKVLNDEKVQFNEVRNGNLIEEKDAFDILSEFLDINTETGEPFVIFTGNTTKNRSKVYEKNDIHVTNSNLCMEILIQHSREEIAVCCLSSLNLEHYEEFKPFLELLVESTAFFLHHVLTETYELCDIISAEKPEFKYTLDKVKRAIKDDHSIGIGVMGYHTAHQMKHISLESPMAMGYTKEIFSNIRKYADIANEKLGLEFGACTKAKRVGLNSCFSNMIAVAPTSSISLIAGVPSPGIDPDAGVIYNLQQEEGSTSIENPYFMKLMEEYRVENNLSIEWYNEQKKSIIQKRGTVQHLDWLDDYSKSVYKIAYEIDQNYIIELAAARQEHIDQSQSLNLWFYANVHKQILFNIFVKAWRLGIKTIYYRRMKQSMATNDSGSLLSNMSNNVNSYTKEQLMYQECTNCQ